MVEEQNTNKSLQATENLQETTNEVVDSQVHLCTVFMTIGAPPGQVGFTKQAKQILADSLNINPKSVRGSYAILGASLHPLMRQGSALRRNLTAIRDKWTIPEYGVRATAAKSNSMRMCRVAGSYLIENSNIEKFLQEYEIAAQQYLAWGEQVTDPDNYAEIRELDRKNLGDDWVIVEPRYPSCAALAESISCETPKIQPYAASFDLADVAPAAMQQLREQMLARIAASAEGATAELLYQLQTHVENVARTCGTRVRVNPPQSHPLRSALFGAEVLRKYTVLEAEEADLSVPEGSFAYEFQPAEPKDSGKWKQKGEPKIYFLTEEEYNALLPFETDEYRSLQTSSFQNVLDVATKIQEVTNMLKPGETSKNLLETAELVKSKLLEIGSSPKQITSQMRNSSYVRKALKNSMQALASSLKHETTKIARRHEGVRKVVL